MVSEIQVAVIQLYSKPLDVAGNFARAESFIRLAANQGADLAVLPEYHLHSWRSDHELILTAARQSAPYLAKYRALAKELSIAIVPGTILELVPDSLAIATETTTGQDDDVNAGIANVAYFIGADGDVVGRYQKKNLWHPERPILAADVDSPHEPFLYEPWGIRIGMLICWDLAFPEAMRELVSQGAQMVVCPTCWLADDNGPEGDTVNPLSEKVFVESAVVARAFENTCAFVFCNAGGPAPAPSSREALPGPGEDEDDENRYLGLSQVAMPLLGALGKLDAEEGMSVVKVDLRVLEMAEETYKVRADMGAEGWHYAHTLRDLADKGEMS